MREYARNRRCSLAAVQRAAREGRIRLGGIFATALTLSACSQDPRSSLEENLVGNPARSTVTLPSKNFVELSNGRIRLTGHWVLRTSEPPLAPGDLPFAAQPLTPPSSSARKRQERAWSIGLR